MHITHKQELYTMKRSACQCSVFAAIYVAAQLQRLEVTGKRRREDRQGRGERTSEETRENSGSQLRGSDDEDRDPRRGGNKN